MFHDNYDNQIIESKTQNYYFVESMFFMYQFGKTVSEQGINIIIDGMLEEKNEFIIKYKKTNYEILLDTFKSHNIFMVEVFCPLDECRRRNISRGDRGKNQSYKQSKVMNKNVKYNFSVDTSVDDAYECAKKIINELYRDSINNV